MEGRIFPKLIEGEGGGISGGGEEILPKIN